MATSSLSFLLLSLLAGAASACPCTTLFYNSATTTTYYPYKALLRNPNPNSLFRNQKPHYLTLIFTSTPPTPSPIAASVYIDSDTATSFGDNSKSSLMMTSSDFPLKFYSSVSSSIRKHTKDIMSVIGALLFGVGYGALPTAITYFVWPLLK